MLKILKFAKKSWYIIIIIIALLFVQANCELALPQYTSNIVDIGIQYGGIEEPIPEILRSQTVETMLLFMEDEQKQIFFDNYILLEREKLSDAEYQNYQKKYPALENENLYLLNQRDLNKEERQLQSEKLRSILVPVETMLLLLTSDGEQAVALRENMMSSMDMQGSSKESFFEVLKELPTEALTKMKDEIANTMQKTSDTLAESMAISFIQREYQEIGIVLADYQMSYLKNTGFKMLGFALLAMIVAVIVGFLASRLAASTSRDLRDRIFQKVVGFSNAEMNQFSTSSLITRCTNDVQQVQQVLVMMFRIVAYAPIMGIGGIIKVLNTNTSMTWIIALAVGLIFCIVMILLKVAMPKFKIMQILLDKLNLVTREILIGIPVIRAFSREKFEEDRFENASKDLMKTQLFTTRSMAIMMPTMMLIMNGITVLIIWVGAHGIDMGNLQVGDMMAFITYTMQIVMSFLMITMVSIMLPRAAVAANRIEEVLNSETFIHNPENPERINASDRGIVSFEHVFFRYPNASEDALEDIHFTANCGETTAIIGSTGCGKSTLVQMIPRLFDVTKGRITIDGKDIRSIDLKELRKEIGYVPQKGILFSGTIASNLRFGAKHATDKEIEEAAEIAQAKEFIDSKPERYETEISQGGTNVSGGQKQRLAIARAVAKNPRIYIFDDSFSALDYKTDIALRKALKKKVSNATVIIVAQRISTIIHAEKIIVLDDGKIVGMGTHEELLKNNEVYQQIASSQLSKEELENSGTAGREA